MADQEKPEADMDEWQDVSQGEEGSPGGSESAQNMNTSAPSTTQSQAESVAGSSNDASPAPPPTQPVSQGLSAPSLHAPTIPSPLSSATPVTPGTPPASGVLETPAHSASRSVSSIRGSGRGRGRGGMRGSRRRKSLGTPLKVDRTDDDSEEEFTMDGVKTKSGRKVHRPTHFDPAVKTPTRRRGPYRRLYDSRICKICQRGHSPQSNMIVFCDGCNTPYHQLCHDPPIDDLLIAVPDAEWYCKDCGKKTDGQPLITGMSGQNLTDEEKRAYLSGLPVGSLVDLLIFCEKAHPDLKIYSPDTKRIVAGNKSAPEASSATPAAAPVPVPPKTNGELTAHVGMGGRASINYEELIIRCLWAVNDPVGIQPKFIWHWLKSNYPNLANREVRFEAQNPLQKLLRLNRVIREGHQYRVNPEHPLNPRPLTIGDPAASNPLSSANSVTTSSVYNPQATSPQDQVGALPPGAGIKLPAEADDDELLVEKLEDRAFSHKWSVSVVGLLRVGSAPNYNTTPSAPTAPSGGDVEMTDGDNDVDAEGDDDIM